MAAGAAPTKHAQLLWQGQHQQSTPDHGGASLTTTTDPTREAGLAPAQHAQPWQQAQQQHSTPANEGSPPTSNARPTMLTGRAQGYTPDLGDEPRTSTVSKYVSKYARPRRPPHLTSPCLFYMAAASCKRGALHHQFPWRLISRPRTSTRFSRGMTGGRFPSAAALTGAPSGPPLKIPPAYAPQQSLSGACKRFVSVDSHRQQRSIALNHIPPLPIPHRLEYPLGSRMHLGFVHLRPEARG